MSFGNLEDLTFGMGLKATKSQFVPAKHAALDGWSAFADTGKRNATFGVLGTLLLAVIIYKLTR